MSKMEASVTKKPGTKRRDSQPDVISHSPSISDGEIDSYIIPSSQLTKRKSSIDKAKSDGSPCSAMGERGELITTAYKECKGMTPNHPSRNGRQSGEHGANQPWTRAIRMNGRDNLLASRSLQNREECSGGEGLYEIIIVDRRLATARKKTVGWFGAAARAAGLGHLSPTKPKPWIEQYQDEMHGYNQGALQGYPWASGDSRGRGDIAGWS
ncbi:MAG: hypothetical protein FE78DRAFT_73645 [Acidomyces sp. 'richmondensis']|nr:MAG: hypothetical protein FE78DRAFT_73645 [Acidomyces sp. 'richmondensis']